MHQVVETEIECTAQKKGGSMQEQTWSEEQIQGRLNQREIPFKVTFTHPRGAVMFAPTKGARALHVLWDPALGYPLDQVIDWLATYQPYDPS